MGFFSTIGIPGLVVGGTYIVSWCPNINGTGLTPVCLLNFIINGVPYYFVGSSTPTAISFTIMIPVVISATGTIAITTQLVTTGGVGITSFIAQPSNVIYQRIS